MGKLRTALVISTGLFAVACAQVSESGKQVIPDGAAADEASSQVEESYHRSSKYVEVRDGTKLAVNVYRPVVDGSVLSGDLPAVFSATPYRARFRNDKGEVSELALNDDALKNLLSHGYAVVTADIRGKGASFGTRRGFQDRTEAQDHYDLIEWIADQPWSSGEIGMMGCSYLGGATLQAATTKPPSLKAVIVGASDFDKYTFVRRGGITAQFNTRPDEDPSVDLASIPVDADTDGTLLRAAVSEHSGNTPMAGLWYGMPYRDSVSDYTDTKFWEEVGPYTYADDLRNADIAFYFWVTWKDEPAEQILMAARNLGGKTLIGPGSHCQTPPGIDFPDETRRFFDEHLKGYKAGVDVIPSYRWWTLDAPEGQEWSHSEKEPGADVDRTLLHFASGQSGTVTSANDGILSPTPSGSGQDRFEVDYDVAGKEYFPFWPAVLDEKGLTYTSPPLAEDVVMTGYPVVDLSVSVNKTDAPVFVYLEEVDPQGNAENISFGRLLFSHRKVSQAPYDNAGLPWHSGYEADVSPAVPGEIYPMSIALTPSSKVFRQGHRIRVSVRGADPRQRNLEQMRQSPAPIISVSLEDPGSSVSIPFTSAPTFKQQQ